MKEKKSVFTCNLASAVHLIAHVDLADNASMLWIFRHWTSVWQALKHDCKETAVDLGGSLPHKPE